MASAKESSGRFGPAQVGLHELDAPAQPCCGQLATRHRQQRRAYVHTRGLHAGIGQRQQHATGAAAQFNHGAAGLLGHFQNQAQVVVIGAVVVVIETRKAVKGRMGVGSGRGGFGSWLP